MYELLKHKSEFKWTIKEESSFQEVKKALSSTVGIFRPDWPKEFKLEIDTSHEGIAAISFQKLGGKTNCICIKKIVDSRNKI